MLLRSYTNPAVSLFNQLLNNNIEERDEVFDFSPAVNTREGRDAYHIDVDLPGVKKEDVEVSVDKNILTIKGERSFKNESQEKDYYRVESSYGKFSRSFSLPEQVDVENIRAASEDGVLEVIIPKLEVTKDSVKKIEIK